MPRGSYNEPMTENDDDSMVIELPPDSITDRTWNGREIRGDHHGLIPANQREITMNLNWIDSNNATSPVGKFRINLPALEAKGFVRRVDGKYRLRFQSSGNGIEIATNRTAAPYPIGKWR